jgi:hypothetical protein
LAAVWALEMLFLRQRLGGGGINRTRPKMGAASGRRLRPEGAPRKGATPSSDRAARLRARKLPESPPSAGSLGFCGLEVGLRTRRRGAFRGGAFRAEPPPLEPPPSGRVRIKACEREDVSNRQHESGAGEGRRGVGSRGHIGTEHRTGWRGRHLAPHSFCVLVPKVWERLPKECWGRCGPALLLRSLGLSVRKECPKSAGSVRRPTAKSVRKECGCASGIRWRGQSVRKECAPRFAEFGPALFLHTWAQCVQKECLKSAGLPVWVRTLFALFGSKCAKRVRKECKKSAGQNWQSVQRKGCRTLCAHFDPKCAKRVPKECGQNSEPSVRKECGRASGSRQGAGSV